MTTVDAKKALFIIDGSSILYRSYYALGQMNTSGGVPTQAIFGFCRSIKKLIDDFAPTHMVLVWDSRGPTTRKKIYAEYKAQRQQAPSDLGEQKDAIQRFASLIGIKQIWWEGYEADDLIASFVWKHPRQSVVIVGADKDLFQLVGSHVLVYDTFKKKLFDEKATTDLYGFEPQKLSFYYALVGDASDNIPGVEGIGPKTAKELVQNFDSLEDLYKHLDEVERPRTRMLLTEQKDNAALSLELFTLQKVDIPLTVDECAFKPSDWRKANSFFEEYEFKSLVDKKAEAEVEAAASNWKLNLVVTEQGLEIVAEKAHEAGLFALDTEGTGDNPLQCAMIGFSLAVDAEESYYVPIVAHEGAKDQHVPLEVVQKIMGPIFKNSRIKKILHNAKFDQLVLHHQGMELTGIEFDTLIAAGLLRRDGTKIGLKSLSKVILGEPMATYDSVLGKHKTLQQVALEKVAQYGGHDALQTLKLYHHFTKELGEHAKLEKLFFTIEMPISQILYEMEARGILLDVERLKVVLHEVDKDLTKLGKKISAAIETATGKSAEGINLNSPRQLEDLLFDTLGLPVVSKSSGGARSTSHDVLRVLSKVHPIPALLIQYRELMKLKNTYLEPLPKAINPTTGRVHTSYSQTAVVTGRLSSLNPNLQNIPSSENHHAMGIRGAFVAQRGYRFVSADYSQVELRVLAHMTGDKNLKDAFLHDRDIHAQTASQIFDVPISKVSHDQRQIGKRINFSIIYGMTPYGLSRDLGITTAQAKEYIDRYFKQYPGVATWIESIVKEAMDRGYVETWWGRRRYIPELREKNRTLFEAGRRIAINTPVQGTSAELMKLSMVKLWRQIKEKSLDAHMILQIHDEIVAEVAHDQADDFAALIKKAMEGIVDWKVPLEVSIRTGSDWAHVTK